MPGFCVPWPGKRSAIGPARFFKTPSSEGKRAGALARPQGRVGFADAPMRGNRQVSSHISLHPFQKARAPGEAGTEAGEQHVVATLDTSVSHRFFEGERDRGA